MTGYSDNLSAENFININKNISLSVYTILFYETLSDDSEIHI